MGPNAKAWGWLMASVGVKFVTLAFGKRLEARWGLALLDTPKVLWALDIV